MKQNITKKQWDELDDKQKDKYLNVFKTIYKGGANVPSDISVELPDIGRMIEFLGDDLFKIEALNQNYLVWLNDRKEIIMKAELCDALWIACRYKLKNI